MILEKHPLLPVRLNHHLNLTGPTHSIKWYISLSGAQIVNPFQAEPP